MRAKVLTVGAQNFLEFTNITACFGTVQNIPFWGTTQHPGILDNERILSFFVTLLRVRGSLESGSLPGNN